MPLDNKDEENKDEDTTEVDNGADVVNEREGNNMATQEAGESIVVTRSGAKKAEKNKCMSMKPWNIEKYFDLSVVEEYHRCKSDGV